MAIDKLKKRIFKKGESFNKRLEKPKLNRKDLKAKPFWKEEQVQTEIMPKKKQSKIAYFLKWAIVVSVFLVVGVGAVVIYNLRLSAREGEKTVSINVVGPKEAASGEAVTWRVTYKNNYAVPAESVSVTFDYPEGTRAVSATGEDRMPDRRRDIGTLDPGESGVAEFKGVIFGEPDTELTGGAKIEFRPQNISAILHEDTVFSINLTYSQLRIFIDMPKTLQSGQSAEIKVHVISSSDVPFNDLSVGVDFPEGFSVIKSNPQARYENNIWVIGDIKPGKERIISISGKIEKSAKGELLYKAKLGQYKDFNETWNIFAETEHGVVIKTPFLALSTTIKGMEDNIVSPGDLIFVSLFWKNNLKVPVTNAFLETKIEGSALNLRTLQPSGGSFDGETNTIKWLAGRTNEFFVLQPGEEGRMEFRVRISNPLVINKSTDKNFEIKFKSRIGSGQVPQGYEGVDIEGESVMSLRVRTVMEFYQRGYYYDDSVKNTGPLPPKVGEETTYLIRWSILNHSNDLGNVSVSATLPTYVKWKDSIINEGDVSSDMQYNEETGEITWNAGNIDAGAGITRPPLEIAFQIGLRPNLSQILKSPEIISEAIAGGEDLFTNDEITITSDSVTTAVKSDPKVKRDEERVIQ